jgi:hypothetical protein
VSQRTGQQSDDATHDVEANGENGIGDLVAEGEFPQPHRGRLESVCHVS